MNNRSSKNKKNDGKDKRRTYRREQPKKDSDTKRVNYDNERISKYDKDENIHKSVSNDPSWYARNDELLKSAASIPFSQTTGSAIGWDGTNTLQNGVGSTVPGVISLVFAPVLGGASLDAINAAKDSIYSFVVHANSRNTSYNSADLMNVIIAGMNVFSAIGSAIRMYGVTRTYDQRNKYLPDALITAMGFDPSDIRANLSTIWFDINELIARSSQIWIPNTMPVMDRWFWMNSNVYMDSESVKGQYYIYVQDSFWAYNEIYNDQGGGLTPIRNDGTISGTSGRYSNANSTHTWTQFMTAVNGMIKLLVDSEDRGVIMGDILKAYGENNIYALAPIPADYRITPVYDREVLTQIENADILPYNCTPNGYGQEQSTLRIVGDYGLLKAPAVIYNIKDKGILNFHQVDTPTPAQVMVATRLKALGSVGFEDDSDNTLAAIYPYTCGTEIVVSSYAYYYNNGVLTRSGFNGDTATISPERIYFTMAFDWAPWTYIVDNTSITAGSPMSSVVDRKVGAAFGDYDNYTVIDKMTLNKMNTTALYSEFGVPVI